MAHLLSGLLGEKLRVGFCDEHVSFPYFSVFCCEPLVCFVSTTIHDTVIQSEHQCSVSSDLLTCVFFVSIWKENNGLYIYLYNTIIYIYLCIIHIYYLDKWFEINRRQVEFTENSIWQFGMITIVALVIEWKLFLFIPTGRLMKLFRSQLELRAFIFCERFHSSVMVTMSVLGGKHCRQWGVSRMRCVAAGR